ncbi:hypothetical protein BJ878DRAFT_117212 [Calycina marina]|uniref:BHLH domain-containing protein n=1 Tax=Calycina marina TaxID=1763456 RepID=A0A9P8CIG8_9HELO|nr:hypothetical protein BJ878DRAFT_117212 [Calycina marina]
MDSSVAWNNQDPLSMSSHDEFQFLDMGNMGLNSLGEDLQFDYQDFNNPQGHNQGGQLMHQGGNFMGGHDTTMQEIMPSMTSTAIHPSINGDAMSAPGSSTISDLDAQIHYLQNQRNQQQQRQRQMQEQQQQHYYAQTQIIPPTPNSIEMHSSSYRQYAPRSDPQQQQAMYERYQLQLKDQEISFTPLVSPAVTPLETHFNLPEYTIPGAYFSPLSSPALHAQNEHSSVYDSRYSGTTNSPTDLHLDSYSAPASSIIPPRKPSSRKAAVQKPRSIRSVKQSPIVKPRKGKPGSVASVPAQALGDILEPSSVKAPSSKETTSLNSAASTGESENGSISPGHLSDMAPPPLPHPGSARQSPYIHGKPDRLSLGSPATPATLMRMAQPPNGSQPVLDQDMDIDVNEIESFKLPEAATSSKPILIQNDAFDCQTTPTLSSAGAKTPSFQPLPSPAFTRPKLSPVTSQSPLTETINDSMNRVSRGTLSIAPRGSKKRASTSILASPALLPRISPSIKPLLPGCVSVAEDTASMLLASKSNYQNILEGTHLPGVSYPSELSTNLTSKRTSHKIAEQGRRNRINTALQEIATLLPISALKDCGGEKSGSAEPEGNDGGLGKGGAQSANSKASTVELAIEYIKQLKKDLANANKRAEEAERQLTNQAIES